MIKTATVTSLGFNITAKWDGAGLRTAQAQLDALKKSLNSIDGSNLRITVDINDTSARSKLDALRADLDRFGALTVNATAGVTTQTASLDSARAAVNSFGNLHVNATAGVNTQLASLDSARTAVNSFGALHVNATAGVNTQLASLNAARAAVNSFGTLHVNATAGVNTQLASLNAARAAVNSFGAMHVNATAGVNTQLASLNAARAALTSFGGIRVNATAGVNTDTVRFNALRAELTAFGLRRDTATADVNTDSAHTHLTTMMGDLGDAARLVGGLASAAGGAASALGGMGSAAGGAGNAVGSAGNAAGGASSSFSGMASAIGLVLAAMTAIVALAPIAAASVALIPVAFVGAAALIIGSNKGLQASFSKVFGDIAHQIIPMVMPVISALMSALFQVKGWLDLIGPAISDAFAAAAPLIQPLVNILEKLIGGALPGLTSAMNGMKPLLDGMGQGALKLGGYLGQAADVMARIPGLGDAMNGIMGALGQVLLAAAKAIAAIVSADHGQALIQLLQLLSVLITASIPFLQMWAIEVVGLSVILRGLVDVLIFVEKVAKAFFQFLAGTGPIMDALKVAWNATWNAMKIAATTIWNALKIAWKATVDALKIAWDVASAALKVAWNAVWNAMKTAVEAVWNGMKTAWKSTVDAFKTAWDTVSGALVIAWNAVWNGLKTAGEAIWNAMKVAWNAVVQAFATVWNTVSGALVSAWNTVWNGMKTAAEAIWNAMKTAWNAVVQAFATVWSTVSSALVNAWNTVWNGMKTAAEAIWNGMKTAWTTFINAIKTAWDTVGNALKAAWEAIWTAVKGFAQSTWNVIQAAWSAFINAMKTAWNTVGNAIKAAWEAIWTAVKGFAESTWNVIKGAWSAFVNALKSTWDTVSRALKAAWEAIWTAVKGFATSTWNVIKGAWSDFINGIKTVWNKGGADIKKAWETVWNAVKKTAHDIWVAIIKVVDGGVNAAIDVINGILKAWDAVVNAVGLKSLNIKAVGHVTPPSFAEGGMVVPLTYAVGGTVPGFHLGGMTYAAMHNNNHDLRSGGALAGYAPGKDTVPAMLSPGEGVLVPEAVQGLGGANFVHAANFHFSKGRGGMDVPGFSTGGMVSTLGSALASFAVGGTTVPGPGIANPNNPGQNQQQQAAKTGTSGQIGNAPPKASGSISDIISKALGLVIPGAGKDGSTISNIVKGVAHAALGFLGGGTTGTILGFIGEKAISAGFGILGKFADGLLKGKFGNVGNVMDAGSHKIIDGLRDYLINQDKQKAKQFAASAVSGSKSVQAWAPMMAAALQLAGAPASWLPGMLSLMAHESGGNPNIYNTTDSNARAGTPSGGLMQVIGPTFAAYCQPGYCANLLDPMSNMMASINYIQARYGHVPSSPYAVGTTNASTGAHLVGERGPEMVMFGGGETVKSAADTSSILAGGAVGGSGGTGVDLPVEKLEANKKRWLEYVNSLTNASKAAWNTIQQTTVADLSSMHEAITPFAAHVKETFNGTVTEVAAKWKLNWDTNTTLFRNNLAATSLNATTFNSDLKKNFNDNNVAMSAQWKTAWDTNHATLTTNLDSSQAAATAFNTTMKNDFATNGTAIGTQWKTTWDTATTQAQTDFTAMNTASTNMWTQQKATFADGSNYLTNTFFPPVNDLMVTKLPGSFATSVNNIGVGWTALEGATRAPVAAVVDVVYNKGIVGVWNLIAKAFGAPQLAAFTMPGFATGGAINGPGTGTSDSIVARLSTGEHVWTAAEVSAAGGHENVAKMRSHVLGGAGVRTMGDHSNRYPTGGGVPAAGAPTQAAPGGTPTSGIGALASAALGSIHQIANPLINAAVAAGKVAVDAVTLAGSGMRTASETMAANMGTAATAYITANDVAPVIFGGGNTAAGQQWADAQVGKPYVLGGNFGSSFDCSQYQSGIARVILGQAAAPWFTTFAFNGATAPAGFKQNLTAPYMVGVTNAGVGHMAGTINGKNYEATPPAVRSGPAARGWNDAMFPMHYGFEPSIAAAITGGVTSSNHLAVIDAALAAAGVPPPNTKAQWELGMDTLITRESAWNPNAINLTDSNAAAGHPSQGLAQVIPSTFAAYHVAGTSNNILDPVANVAAAIRYIVAVYGSILNVQQANPNLPPKGYRYGTKNAARGWHLVGENGPEWTWFNGGEEVKPNGELPPATGGGDVHINCPITVQGNMDTDAYNRVKDELIPELRMMLQQKVGRRNRP